MDVKYKIKRLQRKKIAKRLQKLHNKAQYSSQIAQKLMSLDKYLAAKSVMVYMPLDTEAATKDILAHALESKDVVCVPVTKEAIQLIAVDKSTQFVAGKFNVPEPKTGKVVDSVEVAIIPMVAFDAKCNRLGHGKGYFDRFLHDKSCFKIGIAFSVQKLHKLYTDKHDIQMDMVITEKEIIYNAKR